MRCTVPKGQLLFDPEIEKTARLNKSKTKEEKRLARLALQEGTSSPIPSSSPPSSPRSEEDLVMEPPPPPEDDETQNVLPCWVSPRRLARLGKQNTKQKEMKSGIIQLVSHHPFSGLDHEDPYQHLSTFYRLAGTLGADENEEEGEFSRLFPHSLIGQAREWYLDQSTQTMTDWNTLEKAFQERFFSEDRHLEAKTSVTTFSQGVGESLCGAW